MRLINTIRTLTALFLMSSMLVYAWVSQQNISMIPLELASLKSPILWLYTVIILTMINAYSTISLIIKEEILRQDQLRRDLILHGRIYQKDGKMNKETTTHQEALKETQEAHEVQEVPPQQEIDTFDQRIKNWLGILNEMKMSKKKTDFWTEPVKAGYVELLFTSVPTIFILALFITINQKNLLFLLVPIGFIGLMILSKPLEKCDFCGKPIKHEIDRLFDFHIQCNCVPNRWRPIWYLWCENIHNKIFKKAEIIYGDCEVRKC